MNSRWTTCCRHDLVENLDQCGCPEMISTTPWLSTVHWEVTQLELLSNFDSHPAGGSESGPLLSPDRLLQSVSSHHWLECLFISFSFCWYSHAMSSRQIFFAKNLHVRQKHHKSLKMHLIFPTKITWCQLEKLNKRVTSKSWNKRIFMLSNFSAGPETKRIRKIWAGNFVTYNNVLAGALTASTNW